MFFNEPPRQPHHRYNYPYPSHPNRPGYNWLHSQQGPFQGYAPPPHHGAYPPQQPYEQPFQQPYQHQQPYGQPFQHQQQPNSGPKLLNAFKSSDGKFDLQKTMTTMDQVVKTANQVSPIVKQVGGYFIKKT